MALVVGAAPAYGETVHCTPITWVPAIITVLGLYCFTGDLSTAMTVVDMHAFGPRIAPSLRAHWPFQGDVDHEVVGELIEGSLEFSDRRLQRHTQASSRLEEYPTSHGGTRALGLQLIGVGGGARTGVA